MDTNTTHTTRPDEWDDVNGHTEGFRFFSALGQKIVNDGNVLLFIGAGCVLILGIVQAFTPWSNHHGPTPPRPEANH